jgi:hypothetical protein
VLTCRSASRSATNSNPAQTKLQERFSNRDRSRAEPRSCRDAGL